MQELLIVSFVTELRRCHAIEIRYLVSHPGHCMDDRDAGIAQALHAEPADTIPAAKRLRPAAPRLARPSKSWRRSSQD